MITFEEFQKLDLRVAKIKKVEEIPGADKLWKLTIDVGEEKTIVAGIKAVYSKEELVGKQIVVVNNLQPVKLRGVESNGMLLAADDNGRPILLTTDKSVKTGTKVR